MGWVRVAFAAGWIELGTFLAVELPREASGKAARGGNSLSIFSRVPHQKTTALARYSRQPCLSSCVE